MIFLLALLLAFGASAQLPIVPFTVPSSAAASPTNVLPSGIAFWWKTNGLSGARVPLWTDSIQSYNWAQSTVNNQPLWDGDSVQFWGTNNMVVTNLTESTWSVLVILKFRDTGGLHEAIGGGTTGAGIYFANIVSGQLYAGAGSAPALTTAVYDMIGAKTTATPQFDLFTNGVSAWNFGASWNSTVTISRAGSTTVPAWFFNGFIHEFIIWTNQPVWTSTTVSNVHWYATNTYPHVP